MFRERHERGQITAQIARGREGAIFWCEAQNGVVTLRQQRLSPGQSVPYGAIEGFR